MRKTIGIKWGNLKTGIIILIAIAILFWTSLSGGGTSIFSPKKEFTCYFASVTGLVQGSPVWMLGVDVGNVRSVKLVNLDSKRRVKVTCRVEEKVWDNITDQATVSLGTIGFLGDKYVEIIPGTSGKPAIKDMDILATYDVPGPDAMFGAGKEAFEKAGSLVGNIDDILARVNRGEGTLGQIATDEVL